MFFPTQIAVHTRSKLKRKCKRQSGSLFTDDSFLKLQPKLVLSQILQIDYNQQTKTQDIKPSQIQTFGSMSQSEIKEVFQKLISREMLNQIIIDTMKLCYLFTPIMQAIETEITSARDQYRVKDVLSIIVRGNFYKYLVMKTQPSKFLFNNRNTEINVQTIISGIMIILANKLTLKSLSDVVLYYRLEEALYETAPHGLPFEFEKIIKAMKKVERNITADRFAKWQKSMLSVDRNVKFLELHHFIYLLSLSQPISKKRQTFLQMQRRQTKLQKQAQIMSLMKEKNNLIKLESQRSNWRSEIKVKGLSFVSPGHEQNIKSINKEFVELRRRIISHKRVKSAYITSKAVQLVKQDLKKNNQKQNEYFLDMEISKPKQPQKQRTLLKKHKKLSFAIKQVQQDKRQQHKKFAQVYQKQLQNHNLDKLIREQVGNQQVFKNGDKKPNDDQVEDIYFHHLNNMFGTEKHRSFSRKPSRSLTADNTRRNMLRWL